jgi:hypothetical protein
VLGRCFARAARASRRRSGIAFEARYSPRVIGLALALALAIPSPVPAARAATHAQGPLVLRANIDSRSAVVAFGGAKPAAVVMEYARKWRPIAQRDALVTPLLPKPGTVRNPGLVRIAATFSAGSRILASAMWLDTKALRPRPKGTFTRFTARTEARVGSGRHYVIAFVGAPGSADAEIWSFRVR